MKHFVAEDSIVRQIWGKSDTVLVIFAGAAAEFALNRAVDWLYFTGRLPTDPLGRLFSTVSYARDIVFSPEDTAIAAIQSMAAIHAGVETSRGQKIPDEAYLDVLFMLIDYSMRSYELLEVKLSDAEKQEVFEVFQRVGLLMGCRGVPETFNAYQVKRGELLNTNLRYSHYTQDLFMQYRKHLGPLRYRILLAVQQLLAPQKVSELLDFKSAFLYKPLLLLYKLFRKVKLDYLLKSVLLPPAYKERIRALDRLPV